MWSFLNPPIEVVTFVDGACWVCFCCPHSPVYDRSWMSGSFETMRWNACVHRLDLGLYSNLKELGRRGRGGGEVRRHSKENNPFTWKILIREGSNPLHRLKQDSEANALPTSYSGPLLRSKIVLYSSLLHTYLCPPLPVEQRPSTTPHHHALFWAALLIPELTISSHC